MKTSFKKRFDPAILREDSKSMTENSRHFILNNGTKKAVFTPNNINYFDESKKAWSPIDSALKTSGDHYVASLGKYNVKIPKQSENETVEVSNDDGKIKWEYLGNKKSLFLPLECGTTLPSTKRKSRLKVNVVKNALLDVPTASHAIFKDAEGDIDLDYYIEGNSVKENIVIHDKGDDYHYYFLLRASGFRVKTKDNGSQIEFYKSVASGEDEPQTPEFVMPAPFMYDANGAHSNAVKYSMERVDNEYYTFEVCADETWINNSNRVFPVCIDPHLVIPTENRITVTHEKYQWCECCCGSNTCLESEWVYIGNFCCGMNHIHLQSDDCNRIKAKLHIQKSGIDLTRNKVIKVTLKFNNISYTYNNRIRIGNSTYYTRSSSLNADITGLYNAATESFNVNMEMVSTGRCIFNSMPTIEIDYQSICDDPVRKTLSVENGVAAEFDVLSGNATVMIDDISDPVLGISVSHIYKSNDSITEYGTNFRLNLDEKLEKAGNKFAYTDSHGDVHTFKEHFYSIGTDGKKDYVSSNQVSSITADADGRLWKDEKEVFRELRTDRGGLRATSRLEGTVNNAEWVEQRIDEEKQAEEQVKGYKDTLCNFVSVNKSTGKTTAMEEWRLSSPDYVESFLGEIGCASHLLLSKEEALAYKSLLTQKQSLNISIATLRAQKNSLKNTAEMLWAQEKANNSFDYQRKSNQYQREMLLVEKRAMESAKTIAPKNDDTTVYDDKIKLFGYGSDHTPTQIELLSDSDTVIQNQENDLNEQKRLIQEQISQFPLGANKSTSYEVYGDGTLTKQYLNIDAQIEVANAQIVDANAQLDLYAKKSPKYVEQFKAYYKEYLNLKNQLDTLKLQIPVSYLISDSVVKGFNADGDLVVVQNRYGKYVVVERTKYNTSGKKRITAISDQDGKTMTFSYNGNDKLSEICNSIGERVSFEYNSSGYLTAIKREKQPSLEIEYYEKYGFDYISKITSSNRTFAELSYTDTMMLKEIKRKTDVQEISHGEVVDGSAATVSTLAVAYTNTDTILTHDALHKEIYKINQDTELVDAYYELTNNLVTGAERYTYENYLLVKTEKADKSYLNRLSYAEFLPHMAQDNIEIIGSSTYVIYNDFNEPITVVSSKYDVANLGVDTPFEQSVTTYVYNDNRKLVKTQNTVTKFDNGVGVQEYTSVEKRYYNDTGEVVRKETYVEGEELKTGIEIEEHVFNDQGIEVQSFAYNSLDPSSKFYKEIEVDEKGKLLAEFDESGEHKTVFDYERDGVTVKTEKLPNGSKFSYGRDKDGTVTSITQSSESGEENSNVQTRTLDVVTKVKSGNNTVKYEYDSKRRVKSVSLNGEDNYVTYAYSGEHTNAETVTATMKDGTVSKVIKNAHGTVSKSTCGNRSVTNTINQDQQITKTVDSVSGTTNLAYDSNGNVTSVSAPDHTESFVYDDIDHNLNSKTITVGGVSQTYQYGYKSTADKSLDSITIADTVVRPNTDALGRNTGKTIEIGDNKIAEEKISYVKFGDHATNLPSTVRFATNGIFKESVQYKYDSMGNIIEIFENGRFACRYEYDALGRLTREDIVAFGKTTTWAYDNNGNILARYEYAITAKPTSELHLLNGTCKLYTYDDNSDQLMSYNGEAFVYDQIGNPTTYRGKTAVWEYGRQLKSYDGNTFLYDARGRRTAKNGITFTYDSNGNLIKQSNGLEFLYDHTGVFAVKYSDQTYYYQKDALGNVVKLLDSNGAAVVEYKYDAWGKCQTTIVDSSSTTIAELNPFRYRSYYFDAETGFYFLKTRYYDPEIGRFITIDDISYLTPEKINGLNLYAYCNNNPISNIDPSGNSVLGVLALLLLSGVIVHAATLVGSYAVAAVASNWDQDIRDDMNRINWNPFNTNIDASLQSKKVSFYKGSAVWRHSIPDASSCGIFGMIFLNRDENEFNPDSHDALRHEWGHNIQELIIGTPAYLLFVALPSVIYCQFGDYINYPDPIDERMYYSKVWERTADWLGGVNRNNYDPFWTKENFMFW